ncbi:CoA transferase family III [Microcella putealis]|uniref:CoA transferase family III n=1 Tax=Microcella putealis TaxID=337005 RepID=A0A4Q7LZP7_9MICO|nr:CoA transferase [Microcella putealis]RZS59608.1 CoA transferase family III [Microcella putealis]TQM26721.1 CoA transferase family III [Microcella putealis]
MTAAAVPSGGTPGASAPTAPAAPALEVHGQGPDDSAYPVSAFAAEAVGEFALAVAELVGAPTATVDAALARAWFTEAVRLREPGPSPWNPLSTDYRAADGWVRLHMNAPAHRAAALGVLGLGDGDNAAGVAGTVTGPDRDAVAAAARTWRALDLEEAVIAAGGCAGALRSVGEWAAHPQGVATAAQPLVVSTPTRRAEVPWPTGTPDRPLAGVRVLDLTRVIAGPVATRALALLGADVLRVDPPDWDEPGVTHDTTLGKRCARLDAHDVERASTLAALLAEAHVLVHGLRPGALDSLGLDADTRRAIAPGLVEVQVSAYGPSGPWAERRGFDSVVQLVTGIADARTDLDPDATPHALPVQALDHATGWFAAASAVRGIARARETGEGSAHHLTLARTALELQRRKDARGTSPTPGAAATTPPVAPATPAVSAPPMTSAAAAPELPTHPMQSPLGTVDVLAAPFAVDGVRAEALTPPRPLGSDPADWHATDADTGRRRREARVIRVPRRRVPVWAALSGLGVWALQGVPLTVGAAIIGEPVPDPGWWTSPIWAAGAAAQALALWLTWLALSRVTSIVGVLAATLPIGMLAHFAAATAVALATGAAAPPALEAGFTLLALHWASGAALVASSLPIALMLTPLGAGSSGLGRSTAPRYARRGRRSR